MLYRVAQRLGYKTVADLVDEMPKDELAKWLAVCWIDGWGEDYWRSAQVTKEIHDLLLVLLRYMGAGIMPRDFKQIDKLMPRQARPIVRKVKPQEPEQSGDATLTWMQSMIRIHHRRD